MSRCERQIFACGLATISILTFAAVCRADDTPKTDAFPNGKPHYVYSVDTEGRKSGPYQALDPDGHVLVQATFKSGHVDGSYKSFYSNGKPKAVATFVDGQLFNKYQEFDEAGVPTLAETYKASLLNGDRQVFAAGKPARNEKWLDGKLVASVGVKAGKLHGSRVQYSGDQIVVDDYWLNGQLLYSKGPKIIEQELAAIEKMPVPLVGQFPAVPEKLGARLREPSLLAEQEAGLRQLMSYRYLCDLAYKDMQIDRDYLAHDQAGAEILTKVGKLTHTPENPGMPDDEYKFAYTGTSSSNIYGGSGKVRAADSVNAYMNDSDSGNVSALGHRRWCLNPAMLKTAFGVDGGFSAMWSFDGSRKDAPDYEAVGFPPSGMMPTSHFNKDYAWSLSFNPAKYTTPDEKSVTVAVYAVRFDPETAEFEREKQPLEMEYLKVNTAGYGVANCLIFHPKDVSVAAGAAYQVQISGIKNSAGQDVPVEYFVGFFERAKKKKSGGTV